jgi:hypothetical protein
MLRVVGDEAVKDGVGGRSLLDEIAREGARRMLLAALEASLTVTTCTCGAMASTATSGWRTTASARS